MKEFIETNPSLRAIKRSCEKKMAGVEDKMRQHRKEAPRTDKSIFIKNKHIAATKIQRFWRKVKIKDELSQDVYSYLSLGNVTDHRSVIMFGLHVSELSNSSLDKSSNPFLDHKREYHRLDKIAGKLMEGLWAWFEVPIEDCVTGT